MSRTASFPPACRTWRSVFGVCTSARTSACGSPRQNCPQNNTRSRRRLEIASGNIRGPMDETDIAHMGRCSKTASLAVLEAVRNASLYSARLAHACAAVPMVRSRELVTIVQPAASAHDIANRLRPSLRAGPATLLAQELVGPPLGSE